MYNCCDHCFDNCDDCWEGCCEDECCKSYRADTHDPSWTPMMSLTYMDYRFVTRDQSLYMYDQEFGRYAPGEALLRRCLTTSLLERWTSAKADMAVKWATDNAPEIWDTPPLDRLNVLNGILDVASGKLEPHSPDFLFPIQINAAWNPGDECPAIDRFIRQVFPDDAGELFYQLAGLYALPDTRQQKAVMLLGSGSNGKSVTLALLRQLLGSQNVSSLPLHELAENRFAAAELQGKLLNLSSDLPDRTLRDTTLFKQIVDGRLSTINTRRRYGKPFQFRPFVRLIFSANRVPDSADTSYGYLRRWLIVPFDAELDDDERDPFLIEKLTTPEELSGLLNHAVSSYRHLLNNGRLIESRAMLTAKARFNALSDPTRLFLDECVELDEQAHILRYDLYREYREWCVFHRLNPISPQKFYQSIREILGVETTRNKGRRMLKGIRLTTPESDSE